jgi:hypothetical protein
MANLINEAQRMQFLAGVINESQLDEADTSIIGGMAKNLYLYLSKIKPNNPVDVNGAPLKNVNNDVITHDKKVKMSYQNSKLAMQGKAKDLGKGIGNEEVTISSTPGMVHALGFVKKEEAEAALKHILDKYPNQFKGLHGKPEVYTNKMDYEWAKHYAPTYSFALVMKDDKEIAKAQSAKPSTQVAQAAESLDIDSIVNEALKAIKEVAPAAPAPAPKQTADVAGLTKMIQSNTSLMNKLKTVNSGQEVTETIAFILNNINPKATGVNKTKLKSIIDQRFQ